MIRASDITRQTACHLGILGHGWSSLVSAGLPRTAWIRPDLEFGQATTLTCRRGAVTLTSSGSFVRHYSTPMLLPLVTHCPSKSYPFDSSRRPRSRHSLGSISFPES